MDLVRVEGDVEEKYPKCKELLMDFEIAAWQAASIVMPRIKLMGCNFHICQAKFRYLQKIGMGPLYRKDNNTRTVCRQLLSLNLLPAEKISKRFYDIMSKASGLMMVFCVYIEKQWINHSVWPPANWSMFMQLRKTNNNAEGFHNHLKALVGTHSPNLFKFLGIIKDESETIVLKAKLLSQKQAISRLSKNMQDMQAQLSEYWEDYNI